MGPASAATRASKNSSLPWSRQIRTYLVRTLDPVSVWSQGHPLGPPLLPLFPSGLTPKQMPIQRIPHFPRNLPPDFPLYIGEGPERTFPKRLGNQAKTKEGKLNDHHY
jgi:hypothetical protein